MLTTLPPELLSSILSHLPLHSSLRPHSALLPLLSTNKHLHTLCSPSLNARIEVRSPEELERFLGAREGLGDWVREVGLSRVGGRRRWRGEEVRRVLVCGKNGLRELRAAGMERDGVEELERLLRDGGRWCEGLERLRIELEGWEGVPWSEEAQSGAGSGEGGAGAEMLALCLALSSLRSLSLSHLPRCTLPSPTLPTHSLRRLELSHSIISDGTLLALLPASQSLRHLSLISCRGFTRTALSTSLTSLSLLSLSLSLPYLHPPSPPSSPSRPSLSPRPLPLHPPHPLLNLLDPLLPTLLLLTHLSLVGPLLSLPPLLPALTSLSLSDTTLTPSSLLPLVQGPTRLPRLRSIEVRGERGEGAEELWGAARDKEVEVVGEVFAEVGRRVGWAVECAGGAEEEVLVVGRRKKRPSGVKGRGI